MVNRHDILQGSDEWYNLRKGLLTASKATAIGAVDKGLKTLCKELVLELIGVSKERFTNSDIERGNELEDEAIMIYEFEKGVEVSKVGFVTNDLYPGTGASPDGEIGKNGLIEVKCRNNKQHFSLLIGERGPDLVPFNQIQMQLLITGRKWCDYVSYNPNLKKSLFVMRIESDKKYQEKLCTGFKKGRELIKEYLDKYKSYGK